MSTVRTKAILVVGIAAVGFALFSFANIMTGSRGGGGFDSHAPPAPGLGSKPNFVQLPTPTGAQAFGGQPRPTDAPPSGDAGRPEQTKADSDGEVAAVEDPYNG